MLSSLHAFTKGMDSQLVGDIDHSLDYDPVSSVSGVKVHQKVHVKLDQIYIKITENVER